MSRTTKTRLVQADELRIGDVIAAPYIIDDKAHITLENVQMIDTLMGKVVLHTSYQHVAGQVVGSVKKGTKVLEPTDYVVVIKRGPEETGPA